MSRLAIGGWVIPQVRSSSSAAARRCRACPIARITRGSPISRPPTAAASRRSRRGKRDIHDVVVPAKAGTHNHRCLWLGLAGAPAFQKINIGGYGSPRVRADDGALLFHLREPVVERVSGSAHSADRILLAARVEQFAQPPDMHIHGAFVDIAIPDPDAVEHLLSAEHP